MMTLEAAKARSLKEGVYGTVGSVYQGTYRGMGRRGHPVWTVRRRSGEVSGGIARNRGYEGDRE